MTNFFLWRGCDISGTGTREAIMRNRDFVDRAIAIIGADGQQGEDSGMPEGTDTPDIVGTTPCSTITVANARWLDIRNTGAGLLSPGTYKYQLLPVDTCTGRTCTPIGLPDLVITALGEQATLAVELGADTTGCDSYLLQRDGVVVGPVTPVEQSVVDNARVIVAAELNGTYTGLDNEATVPKFTRAPGSATLEVGDMVQLNWPSEEVPSLVAVTDTVADTIFYAPRIPARTDPAEDKWFDMTTRAMPYVASLTPIFLPLVFVPVISPFAVDIVAPLAFGGGLKLFDIVTYGTGTALVVAADLPLATQKVALMPFGITVPMPAGIIYLVHRSLPDLTPTFDNGVGLFTAKVLVNIDVTDDSVSNPVDHWTFRVAAATATSALDPTIVNGAVLVITSGLLVSGAKVSAIDDFDGPTNTVRVILDATSPEPNQPFSAPMPGPYGMYFVLPPAISDFLDNTPPATSGSFLRISRQTEEVALTNSIISIETGENTTRSGRLTAQGSTALLSLKNVMASGGYAGGFDAFRRKVVGPCGKSTTSYASMIFNQTLGAFALPSANSARFYAVNETAKLGAGPLVDLNYIRERKLLFGNYASYASTVNASRSDGVSVARFREVITTTPADACPPGALPTSATTFVFNGFASAQNPLRSNEKARVLWDVNGRFTAQSRQKLIARGLTDDEASAALGLLAAGRVLSVLEVTADDVDLDDPLIDNIIDDDRVRVIDLGPILPGQISDAIRRRGIGAIVRRPVCTDPDQKVIVSDHETVALNILSLSLNYQASFNLCDVDAALNSITDPTVRAAIAAVLATVTAAFDQLASFGNGLKSFLNNPEYLAAKEFIAGAVSAIAADPTLGCLFGAAVAQAGGLGLPSFPNLNANFNLIADPMTIRFNLLSTALNGIRTLVCTILNELLKLIPGDVRTAALTVLNCLPPLPDLQGLPFFNVELEFVLTCYLTNLTLYSDVLNEVISEVMEFLNFLALGDGFFKSMGAANQSCSSDENFASIFETARSALGISEMTSNVSNTANSVATFFGG